MTGALVLCLLLGVAACSGDDATTTHTDAVTVAPSAEPSSVTPPVTAISSPAPTDAPTTTTTTTTTTTSTIPSEAGITRPITDAGICQARSARGGDFANLTLTLFAMSREAPIPIQIIGRPGGDSYDAFALVERFFTSGSLDVRGTDTLVINGNTVGISSYPNGNGEARWKLPDGSSAYLRSRGLDAATLATIVAGLTPRDAGAPIPGFDFDVGTKGLTLLHEHLNVGLAGRSASVQCVVASTGFNYRIGAIDADPIAEYGGVIDRPVPLEVGVRDGTLVVIEGAADPSAPRVADVVNAAPDEWDALLAQPAG